MAITISDVALKAGVSKSTVSKVLNNNPSISAATSEKINKVIKELNYTPNLKAVRFAKGVSKNIIFLSNMNVNIAYSDPHMFDIMCGVYHELNALNYSMNVEGLTGMVFPGERAISSIRSRSADGLIIHGSAATQEICNLLIKENIPHIIIGHPSFRDDLCWIDTDHRGAGIYAASHICTCGYKNPVFIAGRQGDTISDIRLDGFRQGMLNHGTHFKNTSIIYTDNGMDSTYEILKKSLQNCMFDIAVCENSMIAFETVRAIKKLKMSIPDDISLLTFDAHPFSEIIEPKPTVIELNMLELGAQAGRMMIQKLTNPSVLIQSFTSIPMLLQGETTRSTGV